jgi:hypothetical protein
MAKTKGASFELMAKSRECHVILVRSCLALCLSFSMRASTARFWTGFTLVVLEKKRAL